MARLPVCFALGALLSLAPLAAQSVYTTVVDEGQGTDAGQWSAQAIVDGKPSIAYFAGTLGDLMYATNTAADGSGTWLVYRVDRKGTTGFRPSLTTIGGRPAIAYYDEQIGAKVAVCDTVGGDGLWQISTGFNSANSGTPSLAEIDGKPAVAFISLHTLCYARNSAANGTGTWTIVVVDALAGGVYSRASLKVIGGRPTIAYARFGEVRLARNSSADGSGTWSNSLVDTCQNAPAHVSMAEVGGNPAVAYIDIGTYRLKYARNSASDGSGAWMVQFLTSNFASGEDVSLAVIGGNPAIACRSSLIPNDGRLNFARSSTADGSGTWNIQVLDSTVPISDGVSLVEVAGRPAISYYASGPKDLKLAKAATGDGQGPWTYTVLDDGSRSDGGAGHWTSQALVGGNPAIAYGGYGMCYARSNSPTGDAGWVRKVIDPVVTGSHRLLVVDGKPAIAYRLILTNELRYARARTADGLGTWQVDVVAPNAFDHLSLALVDGNPAISFRESSGGLVYLRNSAADGTGTWVRTTVSSATGAGLGNSLSVVAGRPAISFTESLPGGGTPQLRFAHATTSDGSGPWTITTVPNAVYGSSGNTQLLVLEGKPVIAYDQWGSFVSLARNTLADGTGTWSISDVPIGGYYFSMAVVGGYPTISSGRSGTGVKVARNSRADASGVWQVLDVDTQTTAVGEFSSLIELSNGRTAVSYQQGGEVFDLRWSRLGAPHVTVEWDDGSLVPVAAASYDFGLRELGSQTNLRLTIRNTGTEPVTSFYAELQGFPNGLEISAAPVSTLPAFGGSTQCVVTYAPQSYGERSSTLTLSSWPTWPGLPRSLALRAATFSDTVDTDGDGLNDRAEFLLRELGFNWQSPQPNLVAALAAGANTAGLYSPAQIQAMHVDAPLLQRDPVSGTFTLRVGLQHSTDLQNFVPFPFLAPQVTINQQGEVEFNFALPGNAAFLRLQSH